MKKHLATILFLAAMTAPALTAAETNYFDLGDVSQQTKFYDEGARVTHPAGVEYIREGGNWVIYNGPVSASVPEPGSWLLLGAGLIAAGIWGRRNPAFDKRNEEKPDGLGDTGS